MFSSLPRRLCPHAFTLLATLGELGEANPLNILVNPFKSLTSPGLFRNANPKASPMRPVRSPKITLIIFMKGERRARNIPVSRVGGMGVIRFYVECMICHQVTTNQVCCTRRDSDQTKATDQVGAQDNVIITTIQLTNHQTQSTSQIRRHKHTDVSNPRPNRILLLLSRIEHHGRANVHGDK
jgi:hypothetical protein